MIMILENRNNVMKNIHELPEKKLQEDLKRQDIMKRITEALEIWILKDDVHMSILRAEALQVLREVFKVKEHPVIIGQTSLPDEQMIALQYFKVFLKNNLS